MLLCKAQAQLLVGAAQGFNASVNLPQTVCGLPLPSRRGGGEMIHNTFQRPVIAEICPDYNDRCKEKNQPDHQNDGAQAFKGGGPEQGIGLGHAEGEPIAGGYIGDDLIAAAVQRPHAVARYAGKPTNLRFRRRLAQYQRRALAVQHKAQRLIVERAGQQ